ncbi:MAG: NUDIX domain-containing protein [Bauldia sp.]|nr:NUDIX domain-containing protein [Bauldia sp.]
MTEETRDGSSVRVLKSELLADDWAKLTKYSIDYRRRDGTHETLIRQVYDRGHGAAILPYDPERGTVLLVRQFRMPVYLDDGSGWLIETCAGLLDELDPEPAIRNEVVEELGYELGEITRVFDTFMSPGSVSERLALFVARYSPADRISAGGGAEDEGEDIEVLEPSLDEALAMVASGAIRDAKTIILLQYLKLNGLPARAARPAAGDAP